MRKNLKKVLCIAGVSGLIASNAMTAFAGTWQKGAAPNENRWWYDNGNGTYANNGWQWIDGNNDGVAECYYFDNAGWMLANTTTPDGYSVNENGAWVENGVVVTKTTETSGIETPVENTSTDTVSADVNGTYNFVGFMENGAFVADDGNTEAVFGELYATVTVIDEQTIQVTNGSGVYGTSTFKKNGNEYIYQEGTFGVIEGTCNKLIIEGNRMTAIDEFYSYVLDK